MTTVKLDRISKWFDRRGDEQLHVLQDIDLDVPEQSVVALLGASGCGKSTLLNIVAGLVTPARGPVLLDGEPSTRFKGWRQLSYMFQEDRLLPWRTAVQNVAFGLEAMDLPRKEREQRAMETLELVGLGGFAHVYPHELSGGMRSRVALARSLVTRPTLLLMDEPFSKLDPSIRSQMHGEVLRLAKLLSTTVLFVTHDVEEAVVLADRVVVLQPRPGRVREVLGIGLPQPRQPGSFEVSEQARQLHARL